MTPGRSPSWSPSAPAEEDTPQREDSTSQQQERWLTSFYKECLQSNPVASKALAAALTGALGAALGSYQRKIPAATKYSSRLGGRQAISTRSGIDWLEVSSFALYGALLGGPAAHYWEDWISKHGPETANMEMAFDQLVVQPPRLLCLLIALDVTRAMLRSLPYALKEAVSEISTVTATSWKFWPIAIYLLRRLVKNRKQHKLGLNVCAVFWTMYLARRRASLPRPQGF